MKINQTKHFQRLLILGAVNLIIASTCAAGSASAQIDPGSGSHGVTPAKSLQPASSTPATAKTRDRRASETPVNGGTPATKTAPDAESAELKSQNESPAPNSELTALRDEMDAAANPQERARLKLKLVDQLIAAGMKEDALAELKAMSEEDRFDPPHFYNIANAMARLGATDAAIKTYRKAIDQRKGHYSRASNNLGVVLMRQGFWDQAYESLLAALQQESFRYAEASFNLGRLYAARGESDLAIREWQRALAVDPEHAGAKRALAGAGDSANITVSAYRPPSKAPSNNSSPGGMRPVTKDSRTGTSSLGRLTVDAETYSFLQRGRSARERGRHEDAVVNYGRVISRMGGYFSAANLELSYSLMALKRNDEAIAALLPVTQKDGNRFPISYYHLARLYELRGDLPRAEENYSRAEQSYRGNNSQFLLDLSRVREKRGEMAGALTALEEYIKTKEQSGQRPDWSDERLTALREKVAASTKH
ncbi:MAG: tetratricopeptide repeat protein [Acidobacteriota bacterium]